jgi:hypothetical protein
LSVLDPLKGFCLKLGPAMPWSAPLSRELPLKDGRTLRTLHDVRDVFTSDVFSGVTHLEHAIDLLLMAAESGDGGDIEAATGSGRDCAAAVAHDGMKDPPKPAPRRVGNNDTTVCSGGQPGEQGGMA